MLSVSINLYKIHYSYARMCNSIGRAVSFFYCGLFVVCEQGSTSGCTGKVYSAYGCVLMCNVHLNSTVMMSYVKKYSVGVVLVDPVTGTFVVTFP